MKSKKENNQNSSNIYNVLLNGFKNRKELLYLFSSYIASNPDFKYNSTYLTDSIDVFFEDLTMFKNKQIVFKKIIDYIKIKTNNEYNIEIIFDTIFRSEILKSSEIVINNEININKLNLIGNKSFFVKIYIEQVEYDLEIKTYDNDNEWKTKIDDVLNIILKNEGLKQLVL